LSISSVFNRRELATMATVPDPRHGVFETLLVIDGRPVELDAHLERLNASIAELFPDRAAPDLGEMEVQVGKGSLRITVMPVGGELEVQTSVRRVEHRSRPVALHCLPVPGGLGAHKWADRRLLDKAQAGLPADALPLIVDADGTVLEASRANVFAVRDGALFTPPLDGSILPGITRMRVLGISRAMDIEPREEPLTRDDLLTTDEVFLTGSVRGIERVDSLDGSPLGSAGEISKRLVTELQLTWTGAKTAI
jgi:para-aminobenzoate synthetase / 4-amino-4-deoxychorismate lyase